MHPALRSNTHCNATCEVCFAARGFNVHKHILLDPHWDGYAIRPVHFLTPHHLGWGLPLQPNRKNSNSTTYWRYGHCSSHPPGRSSPFHVAHYTLTTTARDLALAKARSYNGPCSRQSKDKRTNATRCGDYREIVKWMDAARIYRKACSRLPNATAGNGTRWNVSAWNVTDHHPTSVQLALPMIALISDWIYHQTCLRISLSDPPARHQAI